MPTDLSTMQASMKFFEKLMDEIPKKEEEFPVIREQYQTLGIVCYNYFRVNPLYFEQSF